MTDHGLAQERKRLSTWLPAASSLLHAAVRPIAELPVTEGGNGSGDLRGDLSQVPARTAEPTAACSASPRLCPTGGACHTCPLRVQAKRAPGREREQHEDVPPIVHEVLRSSGRPLDAATRAIVEPQLGHDFGRVRVHTDARAAESARAVDALAYTVRKDIVFDSGKYEPQTMAGLQLIAHELVHVVQQAESGPAIQRQPRGGPSRAAESEAAAGAAEGSIRTTVIRRKPAAKVNPRDVVIYTGGQSGFLLVIQAGKLIYTAPAVSGHPGHGENEPNEGPIPSGTYMMHPGIKQPTVTTIQAGVCGAAGIGTGYQEITCADCSPCSGAHYCNVSCPTAQDPAATGYTPVDCWGPKRIKIEGGHTVTTPAGSKYERSGFFIHGGNPKDAVSSGCIKSLDNGVFPEIRKLKGVKGAVPLCVGSACAPEIAAAVRAAVGPVGEVGEAAGQVGEAIGEGASAAGSLLGL